MHCMYLAEPITKWTNNWYDSTRQHYDLLSHLETLNNIVLLCFLFLCVFIPTSIYFSQYVHDDYGLLLHLRKRISLLLSLCSSSSHVDVASIYDISTYFSTVEYFFLSLSLAVWWDEVTEMVWMKKKGSRIFSDLSMPSQLLCRNNPGGNYKKLFKNHMHEDGATEWQFGHIAGTESRQKCLLEVTVDWQWDWWQLSSSRLTMCPAHFVFALVSWPHWTGNAREDWQEVLSAGSAKIKLLDKKC